MDLGGRGRFIVLEGPDGAGKSLQAARLATALRAMGNSVTLTREPGGTPLGERIRAILLARDEVPRSPASQALLFNAARRQLVSDVIGPALGRGETVICDRWAYSTVAYQGFGSGLDRRSLGELEWFATGGLQPDLVVLLDVPASVGLARRSRGDAEGLTAYERSPQHDLDYHQRVRAGYLAMAAEDPRRWRVIDARQPPDAVAVEVASFVQRILRSSEPTGGLVRKSP